MTDLQTQSDTIRPLVVRFGALGDMVILTVLIRHLYARFGQPVDIVSSGAWTVPLLEGQPGVGNLHIVGSRKRPYLLNRDQQRLVRTLRERAPSPTWLCDMDNHKVIALLRRAGWHAQHICQASELTNVAGPHMCDFYLRFAYSSPPMLPRSDVPASAVDAYGHLHVTAAARADLDAWLAMRGWSDRPYILVQPGNKRTMRRGSRRRRSNSKYWPEENWAAVLRGLHERYPEHLLFLLGVPQEAVLNDDILSLARLHNAYNLAHDLPVPRLMALAERAVGMVSVDTGPAHVAAAVNCSVVTMFGKQSPALYAPRGPSARVACITNTEQGEQSMEAITVTQVLSAWDELHGSPSPQPADGGDRA